MTRQQLIEWSAAVLTILGSWLLANQSPYQAWAFVLYLLANFAWIWFSLSARLHGLLTQQLVLTGISSWGIYRGLIEPFLSQI